MCDDTEKRTYDAEDDIEKNKNIKEKISPWLQTTGKRKEDTKYYKDEDMMEGMEKVLVNGECIWMMDPPENLQRCNI